MRRRHHLGPGEARQGRALRLPRVRGSGGEGMLYYSIVSVYYAMLYYAILYYTYYTIIYYNMISYNVIDILTYNISYYNIV